MNKLMLVFNPKSGKQNFQNKLEHVMRRLEGNFHDIFVYKTNHPNHATELAELACEENFDMLIIVGGDGTFNECVNGLMKYHKRPVIGYIPAGTCCDIGMSLGLSKNIYKSLDIILNGSKVKMDIVKTNERYSCYVTGTGAFIDISYVTDSELKKKIGYVAYLVKGVEELFTIPKMRITVYHDGGKISGKYSLILIINSKRVAGINIIYKPSLDDGLVDVVMYRSVFPFNSILYLVSYVFPFWSTPLINRFQTKKMEIRTNSKSSWNIDGEYGGEGNQIIEVLEKSIEIIVPNKIKKRYFKNQ